MPAHPMNRSDRHTATRGMVGVSSVAASATTLVALLAMTAAVSGAPIAGGTELDGRSERGIRAVAAVVAAAARDLARDLIIGDHSTPAMTAVDPMPSARISGVANTRLAAALVPGPTPLAERLLDLPPPRC